MHFILTRRSTGRSTNQILHHALPIRKPFGTEVDELAGEALGTVVAVAVVDEVIALVEVFVVRQDQPLVGRLTQVLLHPHHLIVPGGRILPGGRGQDVRIEMLAQEAKTLEGPGHGLHLRKYMRNLIQPTFVLFQLRFAQTADGRLEVDQHIVHVDVDDFFHTSNDSFPSIE